MREHSVGIKTLTEDLRRDYEVHGRSLRNPSFWVMASYYVGRWGAQRKGLLGSAATVTYKLALAVQEFTAGTTVFRAVQMGTGTHLTHATGIRIDPGAKLGDNVTILHNVTIGTSGTRPGVATVGNNVFIGANATILGPVQLGDGAHVAANSLVLQDVPANCTAIGVPARILKYTTRENDAP